MLLTLMGLFLLLRDGARLGARLLAVADRWLGAPGERLAEKTVEAVRGTVNGTVLVALGEGILIGIGYVVAGVPHPVLFGILTVAFAMLPLGAWIAFTAAALFLLGQGGSVLAAGGLFAFGAAVMLAGDNFVQPALIGGAIRLPFLLTLIGILGGVETFGLVGLFLGPVIMAALLTVWREWVDAAGPLATTPPPGRGDSRAGTP
jgi:predicted PurR-regulated permease PerM